jgi:hypothetical protein
MSQDHAAFADIRQRHALRKIRSVELLLLLAHGRLLTLADIPASDFTFSRNDGRGLPSKWKSSPNGCATRSPRNMILNLERPPAAAQLIPLWGTQPALIPGPHSVLKRANCGL